MDLFEDGPIGAVKDLFGGGDDPTPRITPRLPANQKSLATQTRNPQVQAILAGNPGVRDAYLKYQNDRVNLRGSAPVSTPNILPALAAARKSRAVTPEPQGNVFQNLTSDAVNLAQSAWKLPFALVSEARQLPDLPGKLNEGLSTAQNPLQALGNVAQLPGVRLFPGSYIASGLRTDGPGFVSNLTEHPLYSALDVLPYASKAASASSVVKTARANAAETANIARAADLLPPSTKVNPISTYLKNVRKGGPVTEQVRIGTDALGDPILAPKLAPNRLGQGLLDLKSDLAATPVGRPLSKAFSPISRSIARASNRGAADVIQGYEGQFAPKSVESVAREVFHNTETRATELGAQDRAAVGMALRTGDASTLTPAQAELHAAYTADAARMADAKLASGDLGAVQYPHGRELYPTKIADVINQRRSNVSEWASFLDENYQAIPEAHPLLEDLHSAVQTYDWPAAQQAITDLQKLESFPSIPYAQARREIQKVANSEARALPARWDTVIKNKLNERLTTKYGAQLSESQAAALQANLWGNVLDEGVLAEELAFAKKTWQEIAAKTPADAAPIYVHNISPDKATRALSTPQFFDYTPSVSSLKERMFDSAGTVLDPEISLRHEALEIIQRNVWSDTVDRIVRTYGRTQKELMDEALSTNPERFDANPLIDAKSAIAREIKQRYSGFNPDSFLNPSRAADDLSGTAADAKIYLPNEVVATLNDLKSQTRGQIARATDPVMRVFRTSVLTLSPRFYLNNVFGNTLLTLTGAKNPLTVSRYAKDALALARNPEAIQTLTLPRSGQTLSLSRSSIRELPAQLPELSGMQQAFRDINAADPQVALSMFQQFEAGNALRKFNDNAAFEAARRGVARAQDFSASFNSIADGTATATLFLEGLDDALTKGLSRDEAIAIGVDHARKVFETWDTLTPTERSVIRSIFPFYSFTRNLLKYVAQYPASHPTRLAIMSSFAKAEEQDFGTGLPQQLSQYLYLSPLDTQGRVQAFAPGGINPLQDVGSYASLLGFFAGGSGDFSAVTKNLNPLLSTTLQQLGVDPTRGQGDLYPDLYLDPQTGTLAARTGNPIFDLASAAVPQSRILTNLLGMNRQFSEQLRTNPEAAGRSLLSAAGLPTYSRTVDLPTERIKSELTRGDAAKKELTAALKAGDWELAERWPSLRPLIEKLKALPPEKLEALTLSDSDVSQIEALKRGAIGTR